MCAVWTKMSNFVALTAEYPSWTKTSIAGKRMGNPKTRKHEDLQ